MKFKQYLEERLITEAVDETDKMIEFLLGRAPKPEEIKKQGMWQSSSKVNIQQMVQQKLSQLGFKVVSEGDKLVMNKGRSALVNIWDDIIDFRLTYDGVRKALSPAIGKPVKEMTADQVAALVMKAFNKSKGGKAVMVGSASQIPSIMMFGQSVELQGDASYSSKYAKEIEAFRKALEKSFGNKVMAGKSDFAVMDGDTLVAIVEVKTSNKLGGPAIYVKNKTK